MDLRSLRKIPSLEKAGYIEERELGTGSFGIVSLYRDRKGNQVAIKRMRNLECEDLIYETEIGMKLREQFYHPNLVKIVEILLSQQPSEGVCMVMEYCDAGNLAENKWRLSPAQSYQIMTEVAKGLEYLNSKGIVHRDIKPANIVLSRKSGKIIPKLCDFGISKLIKQGDVTWTVLGTEAYMAPEIKKQIGYSQNVDVWSFGVVLYELLTGELPFSDQKPFTLAYKPKILPRVFDKILTSKLFRVNSYELSQLLREPLKPDEIQQLQKLKQSVEPINVFADDPKRQELFASSLIGGNQLMGKVFQMGHSNKKGSEKTRQKQFQATQEEIQSQRKKFQEPLYRQKKYGSQPLYMQTSFDSSLVIPGTTVHPFENSDFMFSDQSLKKQNPSDAQPKKCDRQLRSEPFPNKNSVQNNSIEGVNTELKHFKQESINRISEPETQALPNKPIFQKQTSITKQTPNQRLNQEIQDKMAGIITEEVPKMRPSYQSLSQKTQQTSQTNISYEFVQLENYNLKNQLKQVKAKLDDIKLKFIQQNNTSNGSASVKQEDILRRKCLGYEERFTQQESKIRQYQIEIRKKKEELQKWGKYKEQVDNIMIHYEQLKQRVQLLQYQNTGMKNTIDLTKNERIQFQKTILSNKKTVHNLRQLITSFLSREELMSKQFSERYNKKVGQIQKYQYQAGFHIAKLNQLLENYQKDDYLMQTLSSSNYQGQGGQQIQPTTLLMKTKFQSLFNKIKKLLQQKKSLETKSKTHEDFQMKNVQLEGKLANITKQYEDLIKNMSKSNPEKKIYQSVHKISGELSTSEKQFQEKMTFTNG